MPSTSQPGPARATGMVPVLSLAWQRRLADFESWLQPFAALDLGELATGYCSIEFHFADWPQPWPVAVRQALLRRLAGIANDWRVAMRGVEGPVYLGLWIFEPSFLETQLVAASGDHARAYASRHDGLALRGPPALYAPALRDLHDWQWVHHPDTWDWDVADVDPADRAFLLRMPLRRVAARPGQFTASRTVWRGQLPMPAR